MNKFKKYLLVIGLLLGVGNTILIYITFLNAYFNNMKTIVLINEFGEAHLEFVLIPILLALNIISTIYTLGRFVNER